jgi:hypothetical protein
MRLTSVVNGVYYYDCLSCLNGVSQGSVGGHDRRPHTTGVDCSRILDAIAFFFDKARDLQPTPILEGDSGDVEVAYLSEGTTSSMGLDKGITFDNSRVDMAAASTLALQVQVDHFDSDKWRVDYQLDSLTIAARLLTISVTWDDLTTDEPVTKVLRVGQELEDPGDRGYDQMFGITFAQELGSFHHKITLDNDTNDVHYVLLKNRP